MPNKNLGKRIISSKLVLILSLSVLIFFTVNLARTLISRRDLVKEIGGLQQQIDGLETRNKELTGLIEYFKSIDFVESEARTKLNLRKPGEKIIIVPSGQDTAGQAQSENNSIIINNQEVRVSNTQKWWDYFFKI